MHKQAQVGKHLPHGRLPRVLEQALEVHLHPGRNATDEPKILRARLAHHRVHLGFPIVDAIGLPRRKAVGLQVGRHVVRHNPTQPSQMHTPGRLRQFGTALQEDHFAVHKRRASRACNVPQQRVARASNVVGHAVRSQGDVLRARGRAAGLAEIQGPPRPKDVRLSLHRTVHVPLQPLVVPNRHALLKLRSRQARTQVVIPSKRRFFRPCKQGPQHRRLRLRRTAHAPAQPPHRPSGHWQTQSGFPTHGAKICAKQKGTTPRGGAFSNSIPKLT